MLQEICLFFETTKPFVGKQIPKHIWEEWSLLTNDGGLLTNGEIPEAAGSKAKKCKLDIHFKLPSIY